jgi:hypothetical protein
LSHKKHSHADLLVKYQCAYCHLYWYEEHKKTEHEIVAHRTVRRYKCDVQDCSSDFPILSELERHTLSVHREVRQFCDICNLSCTDKYRLTQHRKQHQG